MTFDPMKIETSTSTVPSVPLPEMRELIHCARGFVAGDVHFSYVCSAAGTFRDVTRFLPVSREIKQMADEWAEMATRAWPEMARITNPISEEEFREWVRDQIRVFEPFQGPNGH